MRPSPKYQKELRTAIRAAKAAGKAILRASSRKAVKHGMEFKAEVDTIADTTIKKTLAQAFPEIPFLTEESGFPKKPAEKLWVIDPIDGTTNFLNGLREYATLIALVIHGRIVLGVDYLPATDEVFWGVTGSGAYLNGLKIHVSKVNLLQRSALALDPGYHPQGIQQIATTYTKLRPKVGNIGIHNSNGYTLALIAKGELPALIHFYSKIWECAGLLLIQEAGGQVTDFQGKSLKLDFTKSTGFEFIASNGLIHKELLSWLNK